MSREQQRLKPIAKVAEVEAEPSISYQRFTVIDGTNIVELQEDYSPLSVFVAGNAVSRGQIDNLGEVKDYMKHFQDKINQYHESESEEAVQEARTASERIINLVSGIGQITVKFPNFVTVPYGSGLSRETVLGGVLYPLLGAPEFTNEKVYYPLGILHEDKNVAFPYLRFNAAPTTALYIPN